MFFVVVVFFFPFFFLVFFLLLILVVFFYVIFRERPPSVCIWDHSRTVATNSCLESWQDVSIDEWNFWMSDLGLFMQDEHIIVKKQWSCCNVKCHQYFWLTLNDVVETAYIL